MAKWSALETLEREVPAQDGGEAPDAPEPRYGPEDFPGCESFHLLERALEHYEGRLEFWDGRTETAWKVGEPTSTCHEGPSRRLVQMAERVAMLRGSRIACFGASDLVHHDATGRKRWLMQADEVLYLHPDRVRLGPAIDVDVDPLPDVVLEVDHSTDVRRRKLGIYKESGFPEVWVLVPWESSRRAPGLAIHLRGEQGYAQAPESRAFPGWKDGGDLPGADRGFPGRRGRHARAGAGGPGDGYARGHPKPEDDPITRSVSLKAEARGYERGRGEDSLAASVRAVLRARGIEAALDSPEDRELVGTLPVEVLVAAALACADEADFRRRAREQIDLPHTERSP